MFSIDATKAGFSTEKSNNIESREQTEKTKPPLGSFVARLANVQNQPDNPASSCGSDISAQSKGYVNWLLPTYVSKQTQTKECRLSPMASAVMLPSMADNTAQQADPPAAMMMRIIPDLLPITPGTMRGVMRGVVRNELAKFNDQADDVSSTSYPLSTPVQQKKLLANNSIPAEAQHDILNKYQQGNNYLAISDQTNISIFRVMNFIKKYITQAGPITRQPLEIPEADADGFIPITQGTGSNMDISVQKFIFKMAQKHYSADQIHQALVSARSYNSNTAILYTPKYIRCFLSNHQKQLQRKYGGG